MVHPFSTSPQRGRSQSQRLYCIALATPWTVVQSSEGQQVDLWSPNLRVCRGSKNESETNDVSAVRKNR